MRHALQDLLLTLARTDSGTGTSPTYPRPVLVLCLASCVVPSFCPEFTARVLSLMFFYLQSYLRPFLLGVYLMPSLLHYCTVVAAAHCRARVDLHSLPDIYSPSHPKFDDAAFNSYAINSGTLHTAGGTDYFAWNNKRTGSTAVPLTGSPMPPFIRGKSKFDNWFVRCAFSTESQKNALEDAIGSHPCSLA